MFLKRIGFQGKGLPTPRRSRGTGKITRSRVNRYLFAIASVVSPIPEAPAAAEVAEFPAQGGGAGLTFTSISGNGDGYRVTVFYEFVMFGGATYYITVYQPNGTLVFSTGTSTLAQSVTNAQNAAALSSILEVTLAEGVTEVVYSSSTAARHATIV